MQVGSTCGMVKGMKVLIAFATNSGATQQAAQIAEGELSGGGHTVTTKHANDVSPEDVNSHDAIVLASPSWDYADKEGMPLEDMMNLMKKLETQSYENKPFAILGLGDSSYTVFCGAVDHMEEFVKKVKGKLATPSLRVDGFYYKGENQENVKSWAQNVAKAFQA